MDGYILDSTPHEVYLRPGKTTEITIENEKKPGLTIKKIDSVTGNPLKGAKFELWVSKDNTEDGTFQKLDQNYYYTDENGEIYLDKLDYFMAQYKNCFDIALIQGFDSSIAHSVAPFFVLLGSMF